MNEVLSVADTATRIGVSARRVRALIDNGSLPATRIGSQWTIRAADADTYTPRTPGRPLAEHTAWSTLRYLSQPSAAVTSTRLRRRIHTLSDRPEPVETLLSWMTRRSRVIDVATAEPAVLDRLVHDHRVIIGGHRATTSTPDGPLQIYIASSDTTALVDDYQLQPVDPASPGHTTLRAVSDLDAVPRSPLTSRRVSAPVAALDILDTDGLSQPSSPAMRLLQSAIGAAAAQRAHSRPRPRTQFADQRRPVIIDSLGDLHGPTSGTVTLPVTIDWRPDHSYDLDDEQQKLSMYETVLAQASAPKELAIHLSRSDLTRLWRQLHLSDAIRHRWHDRFPELSEADHG